MTTNTELEECWINAWNELYDIVGEKWQVDCLLPDGSIVDIETYKGYLQKLAYQDYVLKLEESWVRGRHGVIVSRFRR